MKMNMKEIDKLVDDLDNSQSDFSLFIEGIPKSNNNNFKIL